MAQAVVMRALYQRLGFTNQAATILLDVQGIDSLEEIGYLTDDQVEGLCKRVQRPGGTIPNPAGADEPPIPNPGTAVSMRAEENLKLTAYLKKHNDRVSRPTVITDVDVESCRAKIAMRKEELEHKDPEDPPKINTKNWAKTWENFEGWLSGHKGCKGVPLSHVIREDQEVLPHDDDPSDDYDDDKEEMIARTPHLDEDGNPTQDFKTDDERVWQLIFPIVRDHPCYVYAKKGFNTPGGRNLKDITTLHIRPNWLHPHKDLLDMLYKMARLHFHLFFPVRTKNYMMMW